MGKRLTERYEDDDYFAEPNYDQYSDEELDELYNLGELRSPKKRRKAARKPNDKKARPEFFDDNDEDWLDVDLEDSDLYDDD